MLGTRSHHSLSISVLGSLDPLQAGISDSLALQLTPVCCWNRWGVIPPACCCLVPGCACCSPGTAGGAVSHRGWVYSGHCPAPLRPCRGLWWDSVLRKCWPEGLLGLLGKQWKSSGGAMCGAGAAVCPAVPTPCPSGLGPHELRSLLCAGLAALQLQGWGWGVPDIQAGGMELPAP